MQGTSHDDLSQNILFVSLSVYSYACPFACIVNYKGVNMYTCNFAYLLSINYSYRLGYATFHMTCNTFFVSKGDIIIHNYS